MRVLDTNICIYIMKSQPQSVLEKFNEFEVGDLYISIITLAELHYGALLSNNSVKALNNLKEFIKIVPPLEMSNKVARFYAEIRTDLKAKGTPIGNNDLWIAAHCLSLDATLVSNNVKEFERVSNLKLENWV